MLKTHSAKLRWSKSLMATVLITIRDTESGVRVTCKPTKAHLLKRLGAADVYALAVLNEIQRLSNEAQASQKPSADSNSKPAGRPPSGLFQE
jgi:hypothetical protein